MTTLAQAVGNLDYHYRGQALGYDATNALLTDFSGNNRPRPKLAGTTAFAAYSGTTAMTMRGDCWFGNPLVDGQPTVIERPGPMTWVDVVWIKMTASEIYNYKLALYRDSSGPAWNATTTTFENSGERFNGPQLQLRADGPTVFAGSGNYPCPTGYTTAAWNVIQCVFDPDNMLYRIRVGTGPWVVTPIGSVNLGIVRLDDGRLGYRGNGSGVATPITLTGGCDVAMAQSMQFGGKPDLDNPAAYNAMIAALLADPLA